MRLINIVLGFILSTIVVACATGRINYDYNTEINFADFKTFNWMQRPFKSSATSTVNAALTQNSILDQRIRNAVNRQLATKNLKMDSKTPDILVAYHLGLEDKIEVQDWGYTYAPGSFSKERVKDIRVHHYKEGTLIIDLIDAKTMQLLWRASGVGDAEENTTPEEIEKSINEAVAKLLENYPPKSSS